MAFDPAADLTSVLADLKTVGLGVDVVHSGHTVKGALDRGPGTMTDPMGLSVELEPESVLIKTGSLAGPAPAPGDDITVGGTAYKVREIRPEPIDGALTRIILVR